MDGILEACLLFGRDGLSHPEACAEQVVAGVDDPHTN